MKLERNTDNELGAGKYALVLTNELLNDPEKLANPQIRGALMTLEQAGLIEYGPRGSREEFFVLKLKDYFAGNVLLAYAAAVEDHDREYAQEIRILAGRAGPGHPNCKIPD